MFLKLRQYKSRRKFYFFLDRVTREDEVVYGNKLLNTYHEKSYYYCVCHEEEGES